MNQPLSLGQKSRRAAVGACTPPTCSEVNWEDGQHRKSQVSRAFPASFQVGVGFKIGGLGAETKPFLSKRLLCSWPLMETETQDGISSSLKTTTLVSNPWEL